MLDVELTNPAAAADLEAERLAQPPVDVVVDPQLVRASDGSPAPVGHRVIAENEDVRPARSPPCSGAAARNTMRRWSSRAARAIEAAAHYRRPAQLDGVHDPRREGGHEHHRGDRGEPAVRNGRDTSTLVQSTKTQRRLLRSLNDETRLAGGLRGYRYGDSNPGFRRERAAS